MTEFDVKAFELASNLTKEMIALSTGVLTLSMTFATSSGRPATRQTRRALLSSALAYLVSIAVGLFSLMALTGQLQAQGDIYAGNVRLFAGLQIVLFLVGLGLTIRMGVLVQREAERRQSRSDARRAKPVRSS